MLIRRLGTKLYVRVVDEGRKAGLSQHDVVVDVQLPDSERPSTLTNNQIMQELVHQYKMGQEGGRHRGGAVHHKLEKVLRDYREGKLESEEVRAAKVVVWCLVWVGTG